MIYDKTKPPKSRYFPTTHAYNTYKEQSRILFASVDKKNSTLELADRSSVGRSQREIVFAIRKELKKSYPTTSMNEFILVF